MPSEGATTLSALVVLLSTLAATEIMIATRENAIIAAMSVALSLIFVCVEMGLCVQVHCCSCCFRILSCDQIAQITPQEHQIASKKISTSSVSRAG